MAFCHTEVSHGCAAFDYEVRKQREEGKQEKPRRRRRRRRKVQMPQKPPISAEVKNTRSENGSENNTA